MHDPKAPNGLIAYLKHAAIKYPTAFLPLLGKVLPLQVQGAGESGGFIVEVVRFGDEGTNVAR
jgi:hypothetical protein